MENYEQLQLDLEEDNAVPNCTYEVHYRCKHKIKMTITKKVIVTYCEKCGKILDQVKR